MKERWTYIDIIKIISCFLVIVNHTISKVFIPLSISPTWALSIVYFFISKIAVPLFLMSSGILLLSRECTFQAATKRAFRIIIALFIFSLLYYLLAQDKPISVFAFARDVIAGPQTNAFWYLYVYLAFLLLLPFIKKFVDALNKKQFIEFFMIVVIIQGGLPLLNHYVPVIYVSSLFTDQMPGILFLYFISGYCINKHDILSEVPNWKPLLLFIVNLAILVCGTTLEYEKSAGDAAVYLYFDRLENLFILGNSFATYILIANTYRNRSIKGTTQKRLAAISACTFGIYLFSDLLIYFLWPMFEKVGSELHPIFQAIIMQIIVFVVGCIATYIMRKVSLFRRVL